LSQTDLIALRIAFAAEGRIAFSIAD